MHREHIGAIAVVDDDRLIGIFSERDLMNRVVLEQLDTEQLRVEDVMTAPVITIHRSATADDALKLMDEKHIRHLPVINTDGTLAGMLSVRSLLHEKVQELTDQLDSLEAYFSADGAGG
jgi:CBS domain-containing protein